jgi:hypothetical protein
MAATARVDRSTQGREASGCLGQALTSTTAGIIAVEPMMRTDPTGYARYPAALDESDCPACATGWHTRCCHPDLAEDGDGELVERCCDGLLIARRRRPLWTR